MTSTLLTAALIIGAIILFSIIFNRLHKKQVQKQDNERRKMLYSIIEKHNLRIHQSEYINKYLFGIDKLSALLLHLNFSHPTEEVTLIDLQKVKSAKLYNVESSLYETKKGKAVLNEKRITKMQLAITLKDMSQPPVILPLYDYGDGMQNLINLTRRGEYWQATINSQLQQLAGNAAKGAIIFQLFAKNTAVAWRTLLLFRRRMLLLQRTVGWYVMAYDLAETIFF